MLWLSGIRFERTGMRSETGRRGENGFMRPAAMATAFSLLGAGILVGTDGYPVLWIDELMTWIFLDLILLCLQL